MYKATTLVIFFASLSGILAVSLQKRDSDHAHERDHSHEHEPANDYHVPNNGYDTPSASYDTPSSSYQTSYDSHQTSYGETSYEPSYEAPYNPLPDITPIIVGIMALLGLSLLFPNNVRINDVRRKRSTAEDANPMTDVVERVNEIYNSVITSEQCMERIACELGGLASDVGLKESPMAKMADLFVTAKYKPYYKQFKSGQNCEKIKCGSLPF